MSTSSPSVPARLRPPPAPEARPGPLSGPVRTVRRQHRRALWIVGPPVALALLTATVLRGWWEVSEGSLPFFRGPALMNVLASYSRDALVFLPIVVGAFVAGPLIARELESGTYRIAWTQAISPARWLAVKLGLALAVAMTLTGCLVVAFRLLRGPFTGDEFAQFAWHDAEVFVAIGPVAFGYTAVGVALGALVALLARHTVPAMVQTAVAVVGVMLALGHWRGALWPMRTLIGRDATLTDAGSTASLWGHGSGWMNAAGERLDLGPCEDAAMRAAAQATETPGDEHQRVFSQCVTDLGGVTAYFDHHTAADFWPLQLVETGILLALAALAGWLAFRVLRRLHG
ncbi:ABC transporter permease [Streptomyces sp. CA-294286]|uniref:ABC transporter permease n=1 Tax=Streptomyces sp. CA-294286 TaxID=3240070 RepID=UPI003D91A227